MSTPLRNVFLVGPMGAGKSSIGRQLANLLRYDFFDSDSEIEKRTGADIPWIFDVEGEEGFRDREAAVIDELSQKQGIVLATGGGCIKRESNRKLLHDRGTVVFLQASLAQQMERTARDKNRPLLQTENPEQTLKLLMKERLPLYQALADITIDTNHPSVREVAQNIAQRLKAYKRPV